MPLSKILCVSTAAAALLLVAPFSLAAAKVNAKTTPAQQLVASPVAMQNAVADIQDQIKQVSTNTKKELSESHAANQKAIALVQKQTQEQIMHLQAEIQKVQQQLSKEIVKVQKEVHQEALIK